MLLPCWGWPNGRESKAKLENPIASGVVWMDQPERETSLELEKRGKAKLGYHMGLETKQRSGQE